jgi:hypothetical protein
MKITLSKKNFLVIFFHLLVVAFLFYSVEIISKQGEKKSLIINDVIVIAEAKPKPKKKIASKVIKKAIQKTKLKKKSKPVVFKKKQVPKKANTISFHETKKLLDKIESSLTQLEEKQKVVIPQTIINEVPKTKKIELETLKTEEEEPVFSYSLEQKLIDELSNTLHLPEEGEVKMKITFSKRGEIKNIAKLLSKSKKNAKYLKKTLEGLVFPWFNQYTVDGEDRDLVILFKNEM